MTRHLLYRTMIGVILTMAAVGILNPVHLKGVTPVRVATFNIHHGNDKDDLWALDEQIDKMAAINADILSVQEVEQFTGYGNMDMAAYIRTGLQSRLGVTYNYALSRTSTGVQVNALYSKTTFSKTVRASIAYDNYLLMCQTSVAGHLLSLVSLHLQHGQGAVGAVDLVDEGKRVTQMVDLNYQVTNNLPASTPRIWLGDFNELPTYPALDPMRLWYYDAYQEAPAVASWTPNGETYIGTVPPVDETDYDRRIDYIFYGKRTWTMPFTLLYAEVVDIRRGDNSLISDHAPVLADFMF